MTSCEHPSLYGTIVCPTYSVGARLGSFEVVQEHFRMVFAHRLALLSVLSSSTALSQRDSRHMRQQLVAERSIDHPDCSAAQQFEAAVIGFSDHGAQHSSIVQLGSERSNSALDGNDLTAAPSNGSLALLVRASAHPARSDSDSDHSGYRVNGVSGAAAATDCSADSAQRHRAEAALRQQRAKSGAHSALQPA